MIVNEREEGEREGYLGDQEDLHISGKISMKS